MNTVREDLVNLLRITKNIPTNTDTFEKAISKFLDELNQTIDEIISDKISDHEHSNYHNYNPDEE